MRILIYAIAFYLLFLALRVIFRFVLNIYGKGDRKEKNLKRRPKTDFDKIEDAEFEEIKKKKN